MQSQAKETVTEGETKGLAGECHVVVAAWQLLRSIVSSRFVLLQMKSTILTRQGIANETSEVEPAKRKSLSNSKEV